VKKILDFGLPILDWNPESKIANERLLLSLALQTRKHHENLPHCLFRRSATIDRGIASLGRRDRDEQLGPPHGGRKDDVS
jgi:hypothetical protein